MADFILGLLWGLLEGVLEGVLEYLVGLMVGVLWTGGAGEEPIELRTTVRTCAGYLLLGALVGAVTLAVYPHRFFHLSPVPGLSLVASPVITGLLMSWTGLMRRSWGKEPAEIESFSYGFFFALGVALLRFLFAK